MHSTIEPSGTSSGPCHAPRPYLHLVDGGLIDNLGVRGLLVRAVASGRLDAAFKHLPPGSVRKIVLVSVNSERDLGERIDRSDQVPGTGQVLNALVFGAGSRATGETLAEMSDNAERWRRELLSLRGQADSPFAADADLYIISVSLRQVQDGATRSRLLQVPTALTILPWQVRQLQERAAPHCACRPNSSVCAPVCRRQQLVLFPRRADHDEETWHDYCRQTARRRIANGRKPRRGAYLPVPAGDRLLSA